MRRHKPVKKAVIAAWASLSRLSEMSIRVRRRSQVTRTPRSSDLLPVLTAGGGLHRALQLRSYKQEVVIMVSDVQRLDSFLQAADSLQQLGLSNILLLSYSKDMCEVIAPVVLDIGCAWSSHKHPADLQRNFFVWSLRYRILAR